MPEAGPGFRCVRAGKAFVAMPGHESDGMVVKLPAARVTELLGAGKGAPVAPAGKVFREWVEIPASEDWGPYLDEALEFAGSRVQPRCVHVWNPKHGRSC
ncbi:MAG: hypothetical protein AB1Z67_05725 [Candidatus Limnocylindrales bacterium]